MKTTILALALAAGTALPQVKSSLRGTDEEHRVGGRAPNFGIIDKGCPDRPLLAVYGPDCPDTSNLPLCNEGPFADGRAKINFTAPSTPSRRLALPCHRAGLPFHALPRHRAGSLASRDAT